MSKFRSRLAGAGMAAGMVGAAVLSAPGVALAAPNVGPPLVPVNGTEVARRGAEVRIGDPGRSYLARDRLTLIAEYSVPVARELEDAEIKRTGVYCFR